MREQGPPVVFTPGTGAPDIERFFERARQCCERLGVPGILLGGRSVDPAGERCGNVLHLREVELGLLLPAAAYSCTTAEWARPHAPSRPAFLRS